ncbi:uncharacterized protein LOC100200963 [Hydra vulgaris]|uniref:Uncharacterized protein LOC100200963 n=1 Tax=Hydra vulgaris TaxID=6087 RepID=A0ABM4D1Z6_HYDVU
MSEIVDCIAFIIRKIFWSMAVFLRFIVLRLLDLLGLVLCLLACCTVFRLPFMIAQLKDLSSFWEWRLMGLIQLLIFLIDVPVFIMGVVICLTLIRVVPCAKELASYWKFQWKHYGVYFIGFEPYGVVVKHFFILFIDGFCVPSAIICLLSWRSVIFIKKVLEAKSEWKKRKTCFVEFLQVLIDIPLLLCFIPVIFSWRLPFLITKIKKKISKGKTWNDIRFSGIYQFYFLMLDVPCLIVMLLTIVTWRFPILLKKLSKRLSNRGSIYDKKVQSKIRKTLILQFLYIFIDIPCIIAAGFVFGTVIHAKSLFVIIKNISSSQSNKSFTKKEFLLRQSCLYEFFMVFVDLICSFLMVIVCLSIWRSYPLFKDIKKIYLKLCENSINTKENKESKLAINDEILHESSGFSKTVPSHTDNQIVCEEKETEKLKDENNEIKNNKKTLTHSKLNWKLRKAILVHFLMLIVDIPAIPLCLFLLFTFLRTSKVVSSLIAGPFFLVFSVTVYFQTLRFFVDLFFILLFFILVFLRPIQAWVHILEDEDHKKYRLTCEFVQWIPDIIYKRNIAYNLTNEILLLSIKEDSDDAKLKAALISQMHVYIESIEKLLTKFTNNDIEDEVKYLLECLHVMEKKRVQKLVRKFNFEKNFMIRPNAEVYTKNRLKWDSEMEKYEKEVEHYFQLLIKYKPQKIPLYETKCGLFVRSKKETRNVLIRCLPRGRFLVILGALLCCLPLYRAPSLLKKLFMRWYDRVDIVVCTIKEYLYDLVTIIKMLFVVLCVYRAPFMFIEVLDCIIEKKSWKSVREAVKKYPPQIFKDLVSAVLFIFSWNTPRFIISTLLFGIFMPADIILGVVKKFVSQKCFAYLLTIIIYAVFMCFPIVLTLYVTQFLLNKGMGVLVIILFCVFFFLLLVILLIMVTILAKDNNKRFLVEMPSCDYVRFCWFNIHVVLFEIIELLQSAALVFKITFIPMYGATVMQTASSYLLLGFISFKAAFWVTLSLFICWFFICSAPIIFENILKIFPVGTCGKKTSWRLLVSLFANTLFVTVVENFAACSACSYTICPYNISLNTTCIVSRHVQDSSIVCWSAPHSSYAAFGLTAMIWFMITSIVFGVEYGDPEATEQDIGFSPIYNSIVNIFKAACIFAATFITHNNYAVLGVLLFCNFSLVIYTVFFKKLFNHDACNLPSFLVWRIFSFVSSMVVTVAVIVAVKLNNPTSKIPLIIIGSGILVSLLVSIAFSLKLRQMSDICKDREEFRVAIVCLKKKLEENNWLIQKWKTKNTIWLRLIKSVREAKKGDKNVTPESWNIMSQQLYSTNIVVPSSTPNNPFQNDSFNVSVDTSGFSTENCQETISLNQNELPFDYGSLNAENESNMPPPPSYDAIDNNPAPPSYNFSITNYDSIEQNELYEDSMVRLQKNGRNLLLILEKHIVYSAFKFSFISQRSLWLNAVCNSNWTGLLHCLQILNSNVDGSFYRPSSLDISLSPSSLETDLLEDEIVEGEMPKMYIKPTKKMLEQLSNDLRIKAIQNISELEPQGDKWRQLFEILLPTISVIKEWDYEPGHPFTLILNKPATGKIVEIAEGGNKLAIGATVTINKKLIGTINNETLSFNSGNELVGKKGPVAVRVKTIVLLQKNNCWYIEANGKKVKFDVAIASCKKVEWS